MRHTIRDRTRAGAIRLDRPLIGSGPPGRDGRAPHTTARTKRTAPASPASTVRLDPADQFAAAEAALTAAGIEFTVVACPVQTPATRCRQAAA